MPFYDIDLSDGRTVTVESDTEPTEQDVFGALESYKEPDAVTPRNNEIPLTEEGFREFQKNFPPSYQPSIHGPSWFAPSGPELDFTRAIYQKLPADVARLTRAGVADVAAGMRSLATGPTESAQFSGNIPAAISGQPLPIDIAMREASLEEAQRGEGMAGSTTAKISQGIAGTLPLLAILKSAPAGIQQQLLIGFTGDMIRHSPEIARELGTELGKPKAEQDPDKISSLVSDALQTTVFTGLGATGLGRSMGGRVALTRGDALRIAAADMARQVEGAQLPMELGLREPVRQLGIPQAALTAEPFLQPGIPELASAALREAQVPRFEVPGELSVLEQLRREVQPPQISLTEPKRLAERIPERGATAVSPTFTGVQVQPGVLKSASDVLLERSMEGRPPVQQMRPIPPGFGEEITAPSVETVRAQRALEARQAEAAKQTPEARQEGLSKFKAVEWNEADFNRYNELLKEQSALKDANKIIDNTGNYTPEWLKNWTEFETIRNQHGGMPPIQVSIANQLGVEYRGALKAGGKETWSFHDPQTGSNVGIPKGSTFEQGRAKIESKRAEFVEESQPKGGVERGLQEKGQEKEVLTEPTVEQVTPLDVASGRPLSAMESLINRLEALKFPETGEARVYSIPHPDAIKAIGRSTWNSAVDVAIAAIKAGRKIGEAVDEAVSFLKKNVKGLDEAKARANLQFVASQETKPAVSLPSTEGETLKMRKSAERATTSPMVPEPVQERIANAPESFYQQQSMKRVEDVVGNLSDADLAVVARDSNLYTASKLEQARRAFERGDNEAGYRVFEELEKEGTMMGQLINQFKLLKGTRPENIVRVINQTLKKAGKDVLNEKQTSEAMEIAKQSKAADAALDKATDTWTKEPTSENAAAAEKALLESNDKALKLQRFISRFSPKTVAGVLKSVLQGHLLTPISEVANLVGNMSFLPFRAMDRTVASAFDVLDNYLKGTKRQITVQPIRGTVEALKGFGRGAKQIPEIFLRGTGDVIKGETRAGLHPIQAWIDQFAKQPEIPTTGGKLTLGDRLRLLIEGTLGGSAEAMLRGLGAGDIAFREAAKARATATELELQGVPKEQWSFAQKFPELFLDDAALQRIQSGTLQAIFQRPSRTLNVITNWIRGRGEWFDLAVATVAPYKMTPWNIVGEILSYNPLVAAFRSLNDFKTGNRASAKLNAGKYIVGSMLTAAGWWLYKNGLMSPSLDQRDEAQKSRILAGEVLPPNHINLSGLKRALTGGDPSFKPGDETVDVFRAGGLAGSMFYMTANIGRDFERMPAVKDAEVLGAILRQSTLEQARFGMNQSFLSGVEGLLSAVREGNADNYVRQWANTVASIPMPNSLTVLSRATRQYKPDFREDTFRKQVENIARNKLGFAKMDDYLPLKRGLWGEPLRETPEGRNALIYHFFDVFKNKQVTSDPVPLELFRLLRKTADTRVVPSIPAEQNRVLTVANKQYPLNAEQYSRYAELVGQSRRRIVDAVVVNPEFHKLPDETKIDLLDRIYDAGLKQGKIQFWNEFGGKLEAKPMRAGFTPTP